MYSLPVEVGGKAKVSCVNTHHPFSFNFHGLVTFSQSDVPGKTYILATPGGRLEQTGSCVSFREESVGVPAPEELHAPDSLTGQSVGVEEEVNIGPFIS